MTFIELAHYALGVDLSTLAKAFDAAKIPHRIYERDQQQVVVVIDAAVEAAKPLLAAFDAGQLPDEPAAERGFDAVTLPLQELLNVPVTIVLVGLAIIGFALVEMQWWNLVFKLLFQPTYFSGSGMEFGTALDGISRGEVWRLLTPIFLHFGALHLVFNCLWCWEIGSRIERVESSQNLLVLVAVAGVVSNLVQYGYSGAGVFGGLSGVVYGFIAYCGISQWLQPSTKLALNPTIYVIMLAFLVLGMTGLLSLMGVGAIANAAHVGGLLSGAAWALIVRQFNLSL